MTLQEAILVRHSVRQYIDKPVEAEKIAQLQALIDKLNSEAGLHMQLVTNEPKAFTGEQGENAVRWEVKNATARFYKMSELVEEFKF